MNRMSCWRAVRSGELRSAPAADWSNQRILRRSPVSVPYNLRSSPRCVPADRRADTRIRGPWVVANPGAGTCPVEQVDRMHDPTPNDFGPRMADLSKLIEVRAYTPAANQALQLLEATFRELLTKHLTRLAGEDRLRFNDIEKDIGGGKKTFDDFTMGQLVGLIRRSRFIEAWARATGNDSSALDMINLDSLNDLRIKIVHEQRPATASEAHLLHTVVSNILETFGILSLNEPRFARGRSRPRPYGNPAARVTAGKHPPKHPLDEGSSQFSIATAADVVSWGWSGVELLEHLIRLDYATIEGLNEDNEGRAEQWSPVFMDHPDTWRLLVTQPGEIVGYWHFVPLFEDDLQRARSGTLLDSDITTDRVCYLELPGTYGIYFVSITVLPSHRGISSFRMLMDALVAQLIRLARHGVFFGEICANAFTPQGEALCKTLALGFVCNHTEFGRIYASALRPVVARGIFGAHPELGRLYSTARDIDR